MNRNRGKIFRKLLKDAAYIEGNNTVLTDNISDIQKEFSFVPEPKKNSDSDPFLNSLDNLKPEDIPLKAAKRKKTFGEKLSFFLRTLMLIVSAGVFVVCSYMLIDNLVQKNKANALYESVASEFDFGNLTGRLGEGPINDGGGVKSAVLAVYPSHSDDALPDFATNLENMKDPMQKDFAAIEVKSYNTEIESMKAQLNSLTLRNPDTYGWIYVPGTTINYQVVQSTDNDYYLTHSTTGGKLVVGSIFTDYRNDRSILKNFNTVFYGHNVTNGSMFNHVTKFLTEETFNNTLIYIYTYEGAYVYEPFAIYETRSDYQYFRTAFASTDEFIEFAEEMQANSKFNKNMEFKDTDRIITLSTCTNGAMTSRYSLQAKLVKIIK